MMFVMQMYLTKSVGLVAVRNYFGFEQREFSVQERESIDRGEKVGH
jgi:hypothetical protein